MCVCGSVGGGGLVHCLDGNECVHVCETQVIFFTRTRLLFCTPACARARASGVSCVFVYHQPWRLSGGVIGVAYFCAVRQTRSDKNNGRSCQFTVVFLLSTKSLWCVCFSVRLKAGESGYGGRKHR